MLRQRSTRLTVATTTALTLMGLNMATTWSWEALLFFRTWHLEPMTRASARGAQVRLLFYVFRVVGGGEALNDDLVGHEMMAIAVVAAPAVDSGLDRAFLSNHRILGPQHLSTHFAKLQGMQRMRYGQSVDISL